MKRYPKSPDVLALAQINRVNVTETQEVKTRQYYGFHLNTEKLLMLLIYSFNRGFLVGLTLSRLRGTIAGGKRGMKNDCSYKQCK